MAAPTEKSNSTLVDLDPVDIEPIDLDPPNPAITRWQELADREWSVAHDRDVSKVVPLPRPAWSDIDRDEILSSIENCRYVSTPVRVASAEHELGVVTEGKWTSAAAFVVVVMTGTGSTRVRVNWSRQAPNKADGWVNEKPFNFTPAEALELADVLRAAVDLLDADSPAAEEQSPTAWYGSGPQFDAKVSRSEANYLYATHKFIDSAQFYLGEIVDDLPGDYRLRGQDILDRLDAAMAALEALQAAIK